MPNVGAAIQSYNSRTDTFENTLDRMIILKAMKE